MANYTRVEDIVSRIDNATQLLNNENYDDSVYTVTGVDWFTYEGTVCNNLYVCGNSWLGLSANSEQLKVNRRDGAMFNLWREEGTFNSLRFLRIRWNGYSRFNFLNLNHKITYDVLFFETGDIMIYIVDIPNEDYNGIFSLGSLSYDKPTLDNRYVTFYLQTDGSYIAKYEPINYVSALEKYLVRNGSTIYTVENNALVEVVGELNSGLFMSSGADTIPDGALLLPLGTPEVLCWTNEENLPTLTATVKGTPHTQTIISDKIHLTDKSITGIESALATCEGELIVAVSFDDKQTWKAWNGEQWATLSDDNTGMSKATLEAITFEQWNEMYTGATGFYIRVSLLDATQSVEKIVFDFSN